MRPSHLTLSAYWKRRETSSMQSRGASTELQEGESGRRAATFCSLMMLLSLLLLLLLLLLPIS